jgi:RNA polymerase sigma-B factor
MTPYRHEHAVAPMDWSRCNVGALFSRSSAGDTRARETIILRFLPMARALARQYEGRGEPIEDLVQAASVGLIKAVDRYSPDRGDAFPAYARPMILGEIRRHFRDTTWRVHVPRPMKERAGRVLRADRELGEGAGGSAVRSEAIAKRLGVEVGEVVEARRALATYFPTSLEDSSVAPDGRAAALRRLRGTVDPGYERVEVSVGVERALRVLVRRDRKILLLRLWWELSQEEIAGRIGISQMHVSRILRNAGAALTTSCGLAVGGAAG